MSVSLNVNASTGIVTSNNTSQLNIVTQTTAHGWNATANSTQTMAGINRITIHYTGANVDGPSDMTLAGLNSTWSNLGWAHGGYHFAIRTNGEVWQLSRINRTSNGAGGQNANNIHIAIMGLFWDGVSERPRRNNGTNVAGPVQPSSGQRTAVQRLVQGLLNNGTLSGVSNINHVFGHRHLPNQSTACPGMTRPNVQALVSGGSTTTTPPASGNIQVGSLVRVNTNAQTWATGQAIPNWVLGQTFTVVEMRNNNTEARLSDVNSWIRVSNLTLVTTGIQVGSRVRVNNNAQTWATGQAIPNWVRGQTFTVQQMRNNNNELLLSDVISWIRRNDVTLV